MAAGTDYDVLLFDLGGVLVDVQGAPVMIRGCGEVDEEVWRRWLTSSAVRDFETGHTTPEQFGAAMVEEFGLEAGPGEFLEAFRDWPRGFYPGAEALLARLAERFRIACLSNSNPLHWARFHRELGIAERFHHRFASHLIGSVKPDREVFEHVIAELGCPPGEILFLDDNQLCVDGAREAGLAAHRARGLEEASSVLAELGVLRREDSQTLGLD